MGIAPDPGTKMDYHQITEDDYWCGEQYYNEFVDEKTRDILIVQKRMMNT